MRDVYNQRALEYARAYGKLQGCGSDSHLPFEFGKTYAVLECDELEASALLRALKTAKLITHKAPFFVHGITSIVKFAKGMGFRFDGV